MKFAGHILAFYLILLAAVPCCAIDDCPELKTAQTASHGAGEKDCGNCSPFFSCEGCAAVTDHAGIVPFTLSPLLNPKNFTKFIQPFVAPVHTGFWQPPKLG